MDDNKKQSKDIDSKNKKNPEITDKVDVNFEPEIDFSQDLTVDELFNIAYNAARNGNETLLEQSINWVINNPHNHFHQKIKKMIVDSKKKQSKK